MNCSVFTNVSQIWTVYLEVVSPKGEETIVKGEDSTTAVIKVWMNVIEQVSIIPMSDAVSDICIGCVHVAILLPVTTDHLRS